MLQSKLCVALLLSVVFLSGCSSGTTPGNGTSGGGPSSSKWLGIPSVCIYVVERVNEATNWALNKNQVEVEKASDVRRISEGDKFIADFKIRVSNGTNSFETTAINIPCDQNGIPTEDSVTKLQEAVEDIKGKIKRLQK